MISKVGMNVTNGLKRSLLSKKMTNMTVSDLAKISLYISKKNPDPFYDALVRELKLEKGGKKLGKAINEFFKWGKQVLSKKNPAALKDYTFKKVVRKGKFDKKFILAALKMENLPKDATIGDMLKNYFKKIAK